MPFFILNLNTRDSDIKLPLSKSLLFWFLWGHWQCQHDPLISWPSSIAAKSPNLSAFSLPWTPAWPGTKGRWHCLSLTSARTPANAYEMNPSKPFGTCSWSHSAHRYRCNPVIPARKMPLLLSSSPSSCCWSSLQKAQLASSIALPPEHAMTCS